jgi:undecaprenyl-diphosphatase
VVRVPGRRAGTVSTAARVAVEYGLPLAVLPGGTFNHFAHDLGVGTPAATRDAHAAGEAVHVGLACVGDGPGAGPVRHTIAIGGYPLIQ